jgi:hypothetical protein
MPDRRLPLQDPPRRRASRVVQTKVISFPAIPGFCRLQLVHGESDFVPVQLGTSVRKRVQNVPPSAEPTQRLLLRSLQEPPAH